MNQLNVKVGYMGSIIGWISEIHSNPGEYTVLRGFNNFDRLHMRIYIIKSRAGAVWCFRAVSTRNLFIVVYQTHVEE